MYSRMCSTVDVKSHTTFSIHEILRVRDLKCVGNLLVSSDLNVLNIPLVSEASAKALLRISWYFSGS